MSGISHTPPGTHKKGLPMLQLKKIRKEYKTGDLVQTALNDVSLNLRDSEFVAILGPSGSGKTTLLNIIGGLDRYDSGDLVINGISTKKYTDRDWDSYRNHTIGFVFQSYNLIPHQTALACHAENAADGAPHLSGNANPSTRQQHLFNGLTVGQCEQQPFTLRIRSGMARAHRQHSVESAADVRKGRHKHRRQPSRPAAGRLLGCSSQRFGPCRTRRTLPCTADAAQMRGLRSERTEVRFKSGQ